MLRLSLPMGIADRIFTFALLGMIAALDCRPLFSMSTIRRNWMGALVRACVEGSEASRKRWQENATETLKSHLAEDGRASYSAIIIMVNADIPSLGSAQTVRLGSLKAWKSVLSWEDQSLGLDFEILLDEPVPDHQYGTRYALVKLSSKRRDRFQGTIEGNPSIVWAGAESELDFGRARLKTFLIDGNL